MSDEILVRRQETDMFFIHNCFGSFFSGVLDWFADEFYPRFNYKVIGTYDKSVKFFKDRKQMGTDPSGPIVPAISLDPMLDFSNEERGGRFLWQHRTLAPGIGMRMWKSIDFSEQDVMVTPVFSRYQGTFETTFWLDSVYELIDFRVALLQFCGGYSRWIRPKFFWSYIVLPDQVENYEINPGIKLDWSDSYAELIHIDTINKQKLGIPIGLDPIWRLDSLADSSTKYGGDTISENKLSGTFTYEVNIPTYIVLSRGINPSLKLSFSVGKTYTKYPLISPFKILQSIEETDTTEKYIEKNFKVFTLKNKEARLENIIIEFSLNSVTYPTKIPSYNYIVSGTLIHLTKEWLEDPQNVVHKNSILFFDSYDDSYIHAIRKCAAVISTQDIATSTLYHKCELMRKPLITFIDSEERKIVLNNIGNQITLDSLNRTMYSGLLEVEEANPQDPIAGFNTLQDIKNKDPDLYNQAVKNAQDQDITSYLPGDVGGPEYSDKLFKRLLHDNCNGIQTRFSIGFIIDDAHLSSLLVYVDENMVRQNIDYKVERSSIIVFTKPPNRGSSIYIGGQLLVIRESNLVAIYEYTDADKANPKNIIVKLPVKLDRPEDLVLVSYVGRVEEGKYYTVDIAKQEVTLLLDPVPGEIVQFFYYV